MLMEHIRLFDVPKTYKGDKRAAAVLVAAGSFARMNGIPKQLHEIDGMPVIAHTISAFEQAEHIREIVLVARQQDIQAFCNICRQYGFKKVIAVTEGGQTRQQSVIKGVEILSSSPYIAIHDGARPLIRPQKIDEVVEAAWRFDAAAAAVLVKDTVKIADDDGFIMHTPERSRLWFVQTPQVFETQLFLHAIETASAKNYDFTDDCQLVENIGHKIFLVKSDYDNIKITTPDDIAYVKSIIKAKNVRG